MRKQSVLAYLVFAFVLLLVPVPRSGVPRAECFTGTPPESPEVFVAFVDGRQFWGSYENRAGAVAHAQRIGACVVNYSITIQRVEPKQKWALRFVVGQGFSVVGTHDKKDREDYFRVAWRDITTHKVHYSPWFRGDFQAAERDARFNNVQYKDDFLFWVEVSI